MKTKKYFKVLYKLGTYSQRKLNILFSKLPESRKERISKIKNNPKYREFLIVEFFIVIKHLKPTTLQDFSYNQFGKPYFHNAKYNFSISHSRNFLIVVFSTKPIGVDIQYLLPFDSTLAKKILNDDEYNFVSNNKNPQLEFTKLWTKKESLTKLHGKTVYLNLKNALTLSHQYFFETTVKHNYVISVCLIGAGAEVPPSSVASQR